MPKPEPKASVGPASAEPVGDLAATEMVELFGRVDEGQRGDIVEVPPGRAAALIAAGLALPPEWAVSED